MQICRISYLQLVNVNVQCFKSFFFHIKWPILTFFHLLAVKRILG